jgi:hypothetical protein
MCLRNVHGDTRTLSFLVHVRRAEEIVGEGSYRLPTPPGRRCRRWDADGAPNDAHSEIPATSSALPCRDSRHENPRRHPTWSMTVVPLPMPATRTLPGGPTSPTTAHLLAGVFSDGCGCDIQEGIPGSRLLDAAVQRCVSAQSRSMGGTQVCADEMNLGHCVRGCVGGVNRYMAGIRRN